MEGWKDVFDIHSFGGKDFRVPIKSEEIPNLAHNLVGFPENCQILHEGFQKVRKLGLVDHIACPSMLHIVHRHVETGFF